MRRIAPWKMLAIPLVIALGSGLGFARAGDGPILGRVDRATGAFTAVTDAPALTGQSRSGTFRFVISITYSSSVPLTAATPMCSVTFSHAGADNHYYREIGSAVATRSGSTGTCTVTARYLWPNAQPTSNVYWEATLVTDAHAYPAGTLPFYREAYVHSAAWVTLPLDGATRQIAIARKY